MVKEISMIFLIGHVLGDYYFQTSGISQGKRNSLKLLTAHGVIYLCALTGCAGTVFGRAGVKCGLLLSITHVVIDYLKIFADKHLNNRGQKNALIYIADQVIHILTIIGAAILINMRGDIEGYAGWVCKLCSQLHISKAQMFAWIAALLLLITPCCITIRIVLEGYRGEDAREGVENAGALIGILERIIVLLLLSAGQYAAIGFILTAKSVARYNKISEDAKFAEYYLLGTLLSTVMVLGVYRIIL